MTNRDKVRRAVQLTALAIQDAVKAAGSMGAPSGPVYAALMTHGCTLDQYNQIIGGMVKVGMLRKSGHLLYAA